jgi:hypothetical protein
MQAIKLFKIETVTGRTFFADSTSAWVLYQQLEGKADGEVIFTITQYLEPLSYGQRTATHSVVQPSALAELEYIVKQSR